MCGRFTLKHPPRQLQQVYQTVNELEFAGGYNIAPSSSVIAITGQNGRRAMHRMRWGLVPS